ncbi:MAG TPA: polyprenyl synthetase family protein [Phycisphaerales bacterium]|nr:polyprenyl synthetase family protein [Phycisphaerales bacterium]
MAIFDIIGIDSHLTDLLGTELEEVSRIFETQLASEFPPVNTLSVHVARYRGKMLRPILVLLSGLAVGRDDESSTLSDEHRTVAVVAEMIHMATLVHDDVLDESPVRRNGATVNSLHGNEMAVMLGDYLISNAFHLCSTLGKPEVNLRLGKITNTLCEGEIVQLHHREDLELTEELYFTIVTRKTASLIGACCELGGLMSQADRATQIALRKFGVDVGIAFQITDDLLDLTADQGDVGKTTGRDLDMGKLTLPLIRALQHGDESSRRTITALVHDRCHAQLRERLQDEGWFDSAEMTAIDLVASARRHLDVLPENQATTTLHLLADAVVARKF